MAFNKQALGRAAAQLGTQITVNQTNGAVLTNEGSNNFWTYNGLVPNDSQATIAGAGYFNSVARDMQVGDTIFVWDNANTFQAYSVTAVTYPYATQAASSSQ